MLFQEVYDYFTSKNCKLLTRTRKIEKLKYIASCDHEHEVHFNVFKSRGSGIICPSCKNNENAEKRSGKASITETCQSIGHFIKNKIYINL